MRGTRIAANGWKSFLHRWHFATAAAFSAALACTGLPLPAAAQQPTPVRPRAEDALSPERAEALHVGMLQLRQMERSGDRAGAIQRGEELLKEFPGNRRVEDALVGLYRLDRREEPLLGLLRSRVGRNPDDIDAVRDLVSLLLSRNDTNEARETLRRFIADDPRNENRYRMAAALLASRNLGDAAIQVYRQGRQAIGIEALFAPELAQLEMDRGEYAAAIGEYLLLAADPQRRQRVWREISALLDRAPDPDEVVDRIEAMRKTHPRSAAIQDVAAMAALQMERYPEALSAISESDRWAGDQGEHLLEFGRMALEGAAPDSLPPARLKVGIEALQLLTERHPDSGLIPEATQMAAEGLVAVARRLPDGDERRTLLRQAVQFIDANAKRSSGTPLANRSLALKGMILFEDLGQPQEALAVFESVAASQRALGEPDQLLQVQIALCHAALGNLDLARTSLEKLVETDSTESPFEGGKRRPNQPQHVGWSRARFYLAEMDLIGGKYDEARDGFAALAEEAPEDRLANDCLDLALTLNETADDPKALQHFGAYRQALLLRDRPGARKELEAIIQESPQSGMAPVALFELAEALADDREPVLAEAQYDALLAKHPQHRLAPRALEASGDLQAQALRRPDLAVAAYERLLTEYPDDLFLDGVRKKLLAARTAAKGVPHATP